MTNRPVSPKLGHGHRRRGPRGLRPGGRHPAAGGLAAEVLDQGVELSVAIDRFAGGQGIRDMQGAWGVLTRNLITRQEAFRIAVIHAFAPFFNAKMYGDPNAQRGSVGVCLDVRHGEPRRAAASDTA